jgi:hypothetical protein
MSAQVDRMVRELENGLSSVKQEFARRLLAKLHEATPVRTGYTRSRWVIEVDGPLISVTNDAGETVMRLNDGSSRQEPAGFIERCIDETIAEMRLVTPRGAA